MVTAFVPGAETAVGADRQDRGRSGALSRRAGAFHGHQMAESGRPTGCAQRGMAATWEFDDPYRFGPVLGEMDEYLLGEGTHRRLWQVLGAHVITHEGVDGHPFRRLGPECRSACRWSATSTSGTAAATRCAGAGATGVWEIFVPGLGEGTTYKYEISGPGGGAAAAQGRSGRLRRPSIRRQTPASCATIRGDWQDGDWMAARAARHSHRRADLGLRGASGVLAARTGQPDAELSWNWPSNWSTMPPTWGSPISSSCRSPNIPSTAHGAISRSACSPRRSATAHRTNSAPLSMRRTGKGLGVLLDWVPGHFPTDPHGLGRFDGTALYEHQDPREGFHQDWNTLIYNYGRVEVTNYLVSNASTGWRNTTSTGCASMRWPRCSTATISREAGRVDPEQGRRARELRGDRASAAR